MKKIFLALGLGFGIVAFTMAGAANHGTAPYSLSTLDTLPTDTTPTDTASPTPTPDTSTFKINH